MPTAALLPPNFTWRSYSGGAVLRRFRNLPPSADDHFPEDWLGSTVRARNGSNSTGPEEGLSLVLTGGRPELLTRLLAADPVYWWGRRESNRLDTGVLWKLLDSSVRLQFQAHPDRSFARSRLNSDAGKTECWYILATRGQACVYLGFQRSPGRQAWGHMIREQQVREMLACFDPIPVRAGDCLVVPAGTPHAIGAGVFMMELQEPSDWVVRCERTSAGLTLPPEACFMGLDLESCLDVFDYNSYSVGEVIQRFGQVPRSLRQDEAMTEEEMTSPHYREFFRLNRCRGNGPVTLEGGELMLLVMLEGDLQIRATGEARAMGAGQTWLLPGAGERWQITNSGGERWQFLLAKLPVIGQSGLQPRANSS
jgi:mannose-6-phosphate isomerase